MPRMPTCGHNSKAYQCATLSRRDVNHFHQIVYEVPDKITQDGIILKYCNANIPKRSRQVKENSSRKGMTIQYYVKKATLRPGTPSKVPVCQKTFLSILGGISKTRVQNICKTHYMKGKMLKDNRGGDTRSRKYENKRIAISEFIEQLRPLEKHYCRGKSSRIYLPSELSLNRLWRMYNESCENYNLRVKKYFFRVYVRKTYNIGFGQPATDACSYCLQLKHLVASSTNEQEKNTFMIAKRVHALKYKEFFNALKKTEDSTLVLSYDCQKNQVLPKVPDQAAYYSRQLYIYNFTVCRGSSKDPLEKNNVFIYTWLENKFPKGCNEIASCVFHNLRTVPIAPNISKVRLFSDGCGGQNKNTLIVGMCAKWLLNYAPAHVTTLEFYFPVVGHSFLPPDRVFARIEKTVKKNSEIIKPEEYIQIFEENGTVIELGSEDCQNFNWKEAVTAVQKKPANWHFAFNPCKRFMLKINRSKNMVLVRGEVNYRTDLNKFRSVLKSGQSYQAMDPAVIVPGRVINQAKLTDVEKLMKAHFGDGWKEHQDLSFYKELVETEGGTDEYDDENVCADTPQEDPCQIACV